MALYSSCGWMPFGLNVEEIDFDAGQCGADTVKYINPATAEITCSPNPTATKRLGEESTTNTQLAHCGTGTMRARHESKFMCMQTPECASTDS